MIKKLKPLDIRNMRVQAMVDVMMRFEEKSLILIPGQAFPVPLIDDERFTTSLWLICALFQGKKICTDLSLKPMTRHELEVDQRLDEARTARGFGLHVLKFGNMVPGLFYDHVPGSITESRSYSPIPVGKFFELADTATAALGNQFPFLPSIWAEAQPSANTQRTRIRVVWNVFEGRAMFVKRIPLEIILTDPRKQPADDWQKQAELLRRSYYCWIDTWIENDHDLIPLEKKKNRHLYLAYDTAAADKEIVMAGVDRETHKRLKNSVLRSYRTIAEGPYIKRDRFAGIDLYRNRVADINTLLSMKLSTGITPAEV